MHVHAHRVGGICASACARSADLLPRTDTHQRTPDDGAWRRTQWIRWNEGSTVVSTHVGARIFTERTTTTATTTAVRLLGQARA